MKKIILFIDNLGSGGAQRRVVNLAVLLKSRGYDITVLVYSNYPFYKNLLDERNISVELIENSNKIIRLLKLCEYLVTADADIVISFLESPGLVACLAKSLSPKWKLITTESSAKEATFKSSKRLLFNIFERFSDVKVCNSFNALHMWQTYYPKYYSKCKVIYNPVIIPEELRTLPPLHKGQKIHMIVPASYQKIKNPFGLIEALNMLTDTEKKHINVSWYGRIESTAGNVQIYEESVKKIHLYNLQDVITLNNETDNIYSIMQQSDSVGIFSFVEGLPNAICEGMMLSKIIIMSHVSDYNVLTDGNGFLCNAESPESICCAIRDMINTSPEAWNLMQKKALKKAKKLFSPDVVIKQWINLIESI